jgi:hypothetical protein
MKTNATSRSCGPSSTAAVPASWDGPADRYPAVPGKHRGSPGDAYPGAPGRRRQRQDDAAQDTMLAGTKAASC